MFGGLAQGEGSGEDGPTRSLLRGVNPNPNLNPNPNTINTYMCKLHSDLFGAVLMLGLVLVFRVRVSIWECAGAFGWRANPKP